jgi:hypothetical protein
MIGFVVPEHKTISVKSLIQIGHFSETILLKKWMGNIEQHTWHLIDHRPFVGRTKGPNEQILNES